MIAKADFMMDEWLEERKKLEVDTIEGFIWDQVRKLTTEMFFKK